MVFRIKDIDLCISWIKKEKEQQKIFFLYGNIGAGKTTFVRRFLNNSIVTSPTFAICHIYPEKIYHFDLYRIDCTMENLDNIGFFDGIINDNLVFIEWAEKLNQKTMDLLEKKSSFLKIKFTQNEIQIEDI